MRNCNPLNIRRVAGTKWKGQSTIQGDKEFVQFESMEYGLRAAFVLLRTYTVKYKAVCIEDIITRWAPPSENDTKRYIETVCKLTGFGGRERLAEAQWPTLVKAMAVVESNMLLSQASLEDGWKLYVKLKMKN